MPAPGLRDGDGAGIQDIDAVAQGAAGDVRVAVEQDVARMQGRQMVLVKMVAVRGIDKMARRLEQAVVRQNGEGQHHLVDLGLAVAAHTENVGLPLLQQGDDLLRRIALGQVVARAVIQQIAEEVKNLSVSFFTPAGEVQAVRDVSFSLRAGEVLAIVGESGCGKSVLCKSILHLLPPSARRKSGTIAVNGRDITRLRERELQKLRGSLFSMVFQDPMTALNPSMTVGAQLAAAVRVHAPRLRGAALEQRVLELMRLVGIDRPEERRGLYPHHFSGGMRQRVVLAIALAGDPSILFADEPTTALDVTIQAQILDLLREIQQKLGTATVFVTHDLGAVARVADRVAVMYAGKIVR